MRKPKIFETLPHQSMSLDNTRYLLRISRSAVKQRNRTHWETTKCLPICSAHLSSSGHDTLETDTFRDFSRCTAYEGTLCVQLNLMHNCEL